MLATNPAALRIGFRRAAFYCDQFMSDAEHGSAGILQVADSLGINLKPQVVATAPHHAQQALQ